MTIPMANDLPCIETLEPRQLFTGFALKHHELVLIGGPTLPNTMTVGLTPGGLSITAQILIQTPKKLLNYFKVFPLSDNIKLVIMRGGDGDDILNVDQTNGSFPIPCSLVGGNGDDTITGGDEPDKIYGGSGNDVLNGGAGNDTIYGQSGNDTIFGGPGNDYLSGGQGEDYLDGGDGNDVIFDARGPDTVLGGSGDNAFFVPSFTKDKHNDFNKLYDTVHFVTYTPPASDNNSSSFFGNLFPVDSIF